MAGTRWWPDGRPADESGGDGTTANGSGPSAADDGVSDPRRGSETEAGTAPAADLGRSAHGSDAPKTGDTGTAAAAAPVDGAPDPATPPVTPPALGDQPAWWQVTPQAGSAAGDATQDQPLSHDDPTDGGIPTADGVTGGPADRAPRRRRSRIATRTMAIAVAGAIIGAAAATLAVPGLRAAAQGSVTITTVPVTPQQEATDSPGVAVYRKVSPSVVLVTNQASVQSYYGSQAQTDWGSGIVLTPTGYIVTNAHVVTNSTQITVTLKNGQSYQAKLIGADTDTDLAVIKINPTAPLHPATFANSSDVVPGELALAIGNPLGPEFEQSVTEGIVSAIRPMLYGGVNAASPRVTMMIQTDTPINPGNSGGALVNAQGEVIGITSMEVAQTGEQGVSARGLGFAIPSNVVKSIVHDLIQYGYVQRAWLGVSIQDTPSGALPTQPQTLTVEQVSAGSPAANAGVQPGDVISSWNGKSVLNYWALVGDTNAASPGEQITLGVIRAGRVLDLKVTLGTEPRNLENAVTPSASSSQAAPSPGGSGSQTFPFPFPFPSFGGQG